MTTDLQQAAKDRGIKYFLVSFTDMFGVLRAKLVPSGAMGDVMRNGAAFGGFANWFDMTPAQTDMRGKPDPATMIQLPWKPEVAWVVADLWMNGKPVDQSPRHVLKRVMAEAAKSNLQMK